MQELKIGPHLTVNTEGGYLPTIQDAYQSDNERGAHWLNNEAADKLNREWPTVMAMAALVEKQRDALVDELTAMIKQAEYSKTTGLPFETQWTKDGYITEGNIQSAKELLQKIKHGSY